MIVQAIKLVGEVKRETKKAILFGWTFTHDSTKSTESWFPRSQVFIQSPTELLISTWIAEQKDIRYSELDVVDTDKENFGTSYEEDF